MSKIRYKFNPKTLAYEKVKVTIKQRLWQFSSYVATGLVFATISIFLARQFLPSPTEKKKQREIEALQLQYDLLHKKMAQVEEVIKDLEDRDDNIYRAIFESDPLPKSIRYGGSGGSDKYAFFENYDNSELLRSAAERMDKITKRLYVQAKSFDEVVNLAKNKAKLVASIPAIMPINQKDLAHAVTSGFGWRTHPIYKTREFHPGMDFSAEQGTPIYATADGKIDEVSVKFSGYGKMVVIDHGFGYTSIYAHLSNFNEARVGKKVKRGDIIGYVGSTGTSVANHLHYEIKLNGFNVDPVNYYFEDLTAVEYERMIEIASKTGQSFD